MLSTLILYIMWDNFILPDFESQTSHNKYKNNLVRYGLNFH